MFKHNPETAAPQDVTVKKIVKQFGGATEISRLLGIHRTNVHKWKFVIPAEHALTLYRYAQKKRMGIKLCDIRPDKFDDNWTPTFDDDLEY